MAMVRISMSKIKEVMRLHYEGKLSRRRIARICGVSRRTAGEYIELSLRAGIGWEEAKDLSESELRCKLFGITAVASKSCGKDPDWNYIHEELKRPNVTKMLLWQEYREGNPCGYQYSYFAERYREWRRKLNVSMRQEHRAGEKVFIDYGNGLRIVNAKTGEITLVELFVGVWGASNFTYAEASIRQDEESFQMSQVRMFEYGGCVPWIIVCDNLKSGVNRACRYEPEINQSYLMFAQHYGLCVMPARPYHPKDKAKVEGGVLLAKRWIVASLRNRQFFSLSELNAAIRELLEKLNDRKMQKLRVSRRELFEKLDRQSAQKLPERRYEYAAWKKARVNVDYHVEIAQHYYSVPCRLIHETVDVRVSEQAVEIFHNGQRATSHVRSLQKYQHTTVAEHMPKAHQHYRDWNPAKILEWAGTIGQNTKEAVNVVLQRRRFPEQAYRSCFGILRLAKYYTNERLENACARACRFRTFSYKSIRTILENNLDRQLDAGVPSAPGSFHENVRGEGYYQQEISDTTKEAGDVKRTDYH